MCSKGSVGIDPTTFFVLRLYTPQNGQTPDNTYLTGMYPKVSSNILKYLSGTYYIERMIFAKIAVDRSVLMRFFSKAHLPLPGTLATTIDCFYVL